jgi:hypothetical protein
MDWRLFNGIVHTISQLGKTTLDLIREILNTASLISVLCFISGGIAGFLLRK